MPLQSKIIFLKKDLAFLTLHGREELWNLKENRSIISFNGYFDSYKILSDELLLCKNSKEITIWDINEKQIKLSLNASYNDVILDSTESKTHPKGLLFLGTQSKVEIWDVDLWEHIQDLVGNFQSVKPNFYKFLDDNHIVTETNDGLDIKVWNIDTGKFIHFNVVKQRPLLLPNGRYLLDTEVWDSKLTKNLFEINTNGCFPWHHRKILSNNRILVGGASVIRIYDLNNGRLLNEFYNKYSNKKSNIRTSQIIQDNYFILPDLP